MGRPHHLLMNTKRIPPTFYLKNFSYCNTSFQLLNEQPRRCSNMHKMEFIPFRRTGRAEGSVGSYALGYRKALPHEMRSGAPPTFRLTARISKQFRASQIIKQVSRKIDLLPIRLRPLSGMEMKIAIAQQPPSSRADHNFVSADFLSRSLPDKALRHIRGMLCEACLKPCLSGRIRGIYSIKDTIPSAAFLQSPSVLPSHLQTEHETSESNVEFVHKNYGVHRTWVRITKN